MFLYISIHTSSESDAEKENILNTKGTCEVFIYCPWGSKESDAGKENILVSQLITPGTMHTGLQTIENIQ